MKAFVIIITVVYVLAAIYKMYKYRTKKSAVESRQEVINSINWMETFTYYGLMSISWMFQIIVISFLIAFSVLV